MKLFSISQEHGQVRGETPIDFRRFGIGTKLRVVPNHACVVVNLFDDLVVTISGTREATWHVAARGRSQ